MADRVLVDTSAWIHALRRNGDPDIRTAVRSATTEGRALLCDMVLLELWNGAQGPREQRVLRELERELEKVPTPAEVWETAGELARACREAGVSAPATDLLIAACAEHHGVPLLHRDAHFDHISRIQRDNRK